MNKKTHICSRAQEQPNRKRKPISMQQMTTVCYSLKPVVHCRDFIVFKSVRKPHSVFKRETGFNFSSDVRFSVLLSRDNFCAYLTFLPRSPVSNRRCSKSTVMFKGKYCSDTKFENLVVEMCFSNMFKVWTFIDFTTCKTLVKE